jgi:transposase
MKAVAYGLELRRRIVRASDETHGSIRKLAMRFAVSPSIVHSYLKLARETGNLAPRPRGPKPRINAQHLEEIRGWILDMPDASITELARVFCRRCHVHVSRWTMGRGLRRARGDGPRDGSHRRP